MYQARLTSCLCKRITSAKWYHHTSKGVKFGAWCEDLWFALKLTAIECLRHSRASSICDLKLLVGDKELIPSFLTRPDSGLWMIAFTCEVTSVVVSKHPGAF